MPKPGDAQPGLPAPAPRIDQTDTADAIAPGGNLRPTSGHGDAVALAYDPAGDGAPTVVATGHGAVADQIVALAHANGVKVRSDADLVALLRSVDLGDDIPIEAFIAVAEILAYIYRANGEGSPWNDIQPTGVAGPGA